MKREHKSWNGTLGGFLNDGDLPGRQASFLFLPDQMTARVGGLHMAAMKQSWGWYPSPKKAPGTNDILHPRKLALDHHPQDLLNMREREKKQNKTQNYQYCQAKDILDFCHSKLTQITIYYVTFNNACIALHLVPSSIGGISCVPTF